jgi:hypothetical protein
MCNTIFFAYHYRHLRAVAEREMPGEEVAAVMLTLDAYDNDMWN